MMTTFRLPPARRRPAAFTLIEMLIVISVIGVLLAMSAPRVFSLLRANELTTQGETLRNWLAQAQQHALATNAPVEVRFFRYTDEDAGQVDDAFRAAQYYQYDRFGALQPESQIMHIRNPLSLSSDPRLSNILDQRQNPSGNVIVGQEVRRLFGNAVQGSVQFASFRFLPDGSTDLDTRPNPNSPAHAWFLTLVEDGRTGAGNANSDLPRNFVCLQIDQFNGSIREFRP